VEVEIVANKSPQFLNCYVTAIYKFYLVVHLMKPDDGGMIVA